MLQHMVAIFNPKWPPKYKNPPIWYYYRHDRVKNWALIISCYVLTLFFIHTTSTCIVRLGDICSALRYSNQYLSLSWMGFYMEIFEARVLGRNLYLHQRFTQCSKWSTSCILFRSCCNILHPSIKYVIY